MPTTFPHSSRRPSKLCAAAGLAVIVFAGGPVAQVGADPTPAPGSPDAALSEQLKAIAVRNGNIPVTEVTAALRKQAAKSGASFETLVKKEADRAKAAAPDAGGGVSASSEGTCGKPFNGTTGKARQAGDFFYSDSCTYRVNHGHNGLFVSESDTVEANQEKGTHYASNAADSPRLNPQKYEVKTDQSNRDKAAEYARKQDGKGYNDIFFLNKIQGENPNTFNCSQLVWSAYYFPTKIDLSSFIDPTVTGVYPRELTRGTDVSAY